MRVVAQRVGGAFLNRERHHEVNNTSTDGRRLYLHGHTIMRWKDDELWFNMSGWASVTTRSRINDVCELAGLGRPLSQHRHVQYAHDVEIPDIYGWYPADRHAFTVKLVEDALDVPTPLKGE